MHLVSDEHGKGMSYCIQGSTRRYKIDDGNTVDVCLDVHDAHASLLN